ncbi:thiamine biosynthetic bifunctional enzyme Thi4 [Lentinula edodes]|uniref:thiamine biosynthetic bifunctional enzyme Thi4 n=1 Tax=Lentinula edodes TaxID=5353 RepID=UPI001E8D911C|nr:thiamine biosynthetic bifunctional enzyme Thi4 [Lentinula edodes]KAH7875373.1 thiamine biosynthetic bifunctional enzyme Thi4 [Lentinula edodes]KAJ3923415.1 thiamine biosynthetic bifunctional enzyme Thi4 [Lentinula edodes]
MIDYSLYLVTGRELLPQGQDYFDSLEQSLQGGVTVVQIREKNTDTREFLDVALRSKVICDRYNVPLIVNDRVDIALAVQAAGVHVGQSDMPVSIARKLLPRGTVIGVSCNNIQELDKAVSDGVDYVGIGAVWSTTTKTLNKPVVGVRGVGELLRKLDGTSVKAVGIGGIKLKNLLRTLHGTVSTTNRALDGVAVVSEIVASTRPREAAAKLCEVLSAFRSGDSIFKAMRTRSEYTAGSVIDGVVQIMSCVRDHNPLVHQITNNVSIAQSANATIALGASPIMATTVQEMEDISRINGALLVNIGTLVPTAYEGMVVAGSCANAQKKPVVFDPVGVGASHFRQSSVNTLLDSWQASVIKGNAGELAALAGSNEVQSKGVDTIGSGFKDPVSFVRNLARKERCVIVMSGEIDYISDGANVAVLSNGHQLLGQITGSGCIAGSCIASHCAGAMILAQGEDKEGKLVIGDIFLGAIGGILALTISAELAALREDVKGPGTFFPALIDELFTLTPRSIQERARIQIQ